MKRYKVKRFKGLVPYGKARHAMLNTMARTLKRLEAIGCYSLMDAMDSRVSMQRRFRRKAA